MKSSENPHPCFTLLSVNDLIIKMRSNETLLDQERKSENPKRKPEYQKRKSESTYVHFLGLCYYVHEVSAVKLNFERNTLLNQLRKKIIGYVVLFYKYSVIACSILTDFNQFCD